MTTLTLAQAADYLEAAAYLETPVDGGGLLVFNVGIDAHGKRFTLITDAETCKAHLVMM